MYYWLLSTSLAWVTLPYANAPARIALGFTRMAPDQSKSSKDGSGVWVVDWHVTERTNTLLGHSVLQTEQYRKY